MLDSKLYSAPAVGRDGKPAANRIDPAVRLHVIDFESEFEVAEVGRNAFGCNSIVQANSKCTLIVGGEKYALAAGSGVMLVCGIGRVLVFKADRGFVADAPAPPNSRLTPHGYRSPEEKAEETDEELRARYEEVTGRKPGRSKRETMLAAIAEAEADESE